MLRRETNQSGSRKKVRRAPASQGHPSQGRPTVGGGTKTKPTVYRSPSTPKPYSRPAPKTQPGPVTKKDRRKVKRAQPMVRRSRKQVRRVRRERAMREVRRNLKLHLDKPKDTDTHIGPLNIEAELEGRGGIQKAAKFAKKVATSDIGRAGLRAGGLPTTGNEKIDKNLAKDVVDLPAQTIPGAYAVGASAVEAAQGRPERGKKLIRETKMHDPVVLTARSVIEGRPELRKRAAREVKKHPGLFAAEVYGVGAAGSRLAGAGARAGGTVVPGKAGKTLRRAGNTKRAPAVAPGTEMREPRAWSRGMGAKAVQVANEKRKLRKARKLREKAKRTRNTREKDKLNQQAAQADPRVMSNAQVKRRSAEHEDLAENRRRARVKNAKRDARVLSTPQGNKKARVRVRLKGKDKNEGVALLIAQNVVKPTRKSLEAYKRQIDSKTSGLSRSELQTNRTLSGQIGALLRQETIDFDDLVARAQAFKEEVAPRQAGLVAREIVTPEEARKSPLVPYAVQEMKARWDGEQLVVGSKQDPRPLHADEIEAHMKANGVDPGVYVTQAPNQRGARNYYSSYHEPKGVSRKSRTGEATRKGTFEANRLVAEEGLSRAENLIAAHDNYGDWLGENMYRGRRGRGKADEHFYDTPQEARNVIANELYDSPYEWEVVSTRPQFGRKGQSESLADRADMRDPATDVDIHEGVVSALDGNGAGRFAIVPKAARQELRSHQQQSSMKALRAWKNVNRQFSGTVLTTSGFTWPLGNVGEGTLRLAVLRAGPASYMLTKKTIAELKKTDPELAADFEYRLGSGYAGAFEMQRTHLSAKDLQGAGMDRFGRAMGTFARAPGAKQFGHVWGTWTDVIFGSNGWIEHQLRLTAVGKYLKREGNVPHWFRDGRQAMQIAAEQAAKGMKGTPEQVAAARFVDRAMGQYSKWTSGRRFAVGVFTPFAAWAVNALKFFVDVLPRDHPVLTGLLAASERTTEEWRKSFGLGKYVDGAAPAWLQPSIVVDGKLYPVGRYTPAGAFADPLETASRQVLPQWNSIFLASLGLDWKGDPLNDKARPDDVSEAERAQAMLKAAGSAFIPFFGLHQRLGEKGGTALNPVRGYTHNKKVSAAFDEAERIEKQKAAIKAKHPKVDSDNPTPEYAKLHKRWRELQELIHRESKGKYGHKFKEPYRPGGKEDNPFGGGGGGSDDDNPFKGGGGAGSEDNPFSSTMSPVSGGVSPQTSEYMQRAQRNWWDPAKDGPRQPSQPMRKEDMEMWRRDEVWPPFPNAAKKRGRFRRDSDLGILGPDEFRNGPPRYRRV